MSAASSRSETARLQDLRVRGGVRAVFAVNERGTYAASAREAEGWRVRFPPAVGACEAVILNTGGGIAGGDEVQLEFALGCGARVTATTAAGERVYRALEDAARVDTLLRLEADSTLAWLPRETILSSGARLVRRLNVEMAARASLTLLDIVVFGRRGSGEVMAVGCFDDRWVIQRGGRLVHVEAVRLDGAIAEKLDRAAVAGGGHVITTLIQLAPEAETSLEGVRQALAGFADIEIAASAWDGKLVVRALAHSSFRVREAMAAALHALTGMPMPRAWVM